MSDLLERHRIVKTLDADGFMATIKSTLNRGHSSFAPSELIPILGQLVTLVSSLVTSVSIFEVIEGTIEADATETIDVDAGEVLMFVTATKTDESGTPSWSIAELEGDTLLDDIEFDEPFTSIWVANYHRISDVVINVTPACAISYKALKLKVSTS